jgi:sugar phosphate isomerase/epimerase
MAAALGIQLYTLREEAALDFPGVLDRLGRLGFAHVEVAGRHGLTAEETRSRVEDAGMEVASLHGMPFGDDAARVFDEAEALGSPRVVVPVAGPDEFKSADAVDAVAARLNAAARSAAERGLGLAYHNHFWEWTVLPDGGAAFDRLVAGLAPEVQLEVDVYWAQTAGCDPPTLLAELGTRASLLHLKDGPADGPDSPMTTAGTGAVDLAAAVAAAPLDALPFVELDACAGSMWDAVEESFRYLTSRGIATARS